MGVPALRDLGGHRTTAAPGSDLAATRSFRAHPSALFEIRQFIRERAAAMGLSGRTTDDIVLAVSEASANSVLHTNSGEIEVTWTQAGECIEILIRDHGVFRRRVPMPELDGHGRGIPLMMAIMDEVAIQEGTPRRPGTTVRLMKCRDR